jgi:2-C-methyl-D-erythritol 2,4-cyclodiphosphate synthase
VTGRVGIGFDAHPFAAGRTLRLGGVEIPHPSGLEGHSDGDALLHAITDALLGSLALPDIGQIFPDSAPENDGRDSAEFLAEAARLAADRGYRVVNVDATVVLERPKLAGRKAEMRARIAEILAIDPAAVNVKGKTHEGVDALGEGRAIEAHAVVLVRRTPGAA